MDRKAFLGKALKTGMGLGGALALSKLPACCGALPDGAPAPEKKTDPELEGIKQQQRFVMTWVADLLGSMDRQLDASTYMKLMESCGEACYHHYKEFLTREAGGKLETLIELYNTKWVGPGSVTRKGGLIEVVYRMAQCSCPVSYCRAPKSDEMRCHCSKGSIKAIFSKVVGRPLKVDLVQSLRRGDPQCKFIVHLA